MEVLELKKLKEKNVDVYLIEIPINSHKNNKNLQLSICDVPMTADSVCMSSSTGKSHTDEDFRS